MKLLISDTFMAKGKGDIIGKRELIPLVGCGPHDARYSLRLRRIADAMMALARKAGDPITVAQIKGDLKILTDVVASRYNADANDQGVRRIRSSNRRLGEVKTASFTDQERQQHDRRCVVAGARTALVSGAMVNRVAKMSTHQRLLPAGESYRSRKG
jgi:hypothetical protein